MSLDRSKHPPDERPRTHGMPRIAYVLKRFPRLSETFILNEILELERQGVEIEIFSLLEPPREPRHALLRMVQAPVTYLSPLAREGQSKNRGEESLAGKLAKALDHHGGSFGDLFCAKTEQEVRRLYFKATALSLLTQAAGISHLHAHFGSDATTVALLASRLSGIPYSYTAHARDIYHTYVSREIDDHVRRLKMIEAAFVVTVSDYNLRRLSGLCPPTQRHKLHRLYNGVDLSRFCLSRLHPTTPIILGVGRLIEKKGFSDLVAACRVLRDRGFRFRCLIVGDGPERASLEAKIDEADLTSQVELLGPLPQEELVAMLAAARVFALPCVISASGDRDGLPTVLLEALAAAVPVVTTSVAGNPEIVTHQANGLLVPPNNPAAFGEALARLLGDPAEAERMGRSGRLMAEEKFDLRNNVAELKVHFLRSSEHARLDRRCA